MVCKDCKKEMELRREKKTAAIGIFVYSIYCLALLVAFLAMLTTTLNVWTSMSKETYDAPLSNWWAFAYIIIFGLMFYIMKFLDGNYKALIESINDYSKVKKELDEWLTR